MPKPWAKVEIGYTRHPKFAALNANAFGLWHEAKDYCETYHTDGLIPKSALKGFRFRGAKSVQMLLASCGEKPDGTPYAPLWQEHPIGYRMHDYLEYNDCRDERLARMEQAEANREAERDRLRRWRDGKKQKRETATETAVETGRETAGETALTRPGNASETLLTETATTTATSTPTNVGVQRARHATLVTPPAKQAHIAHFTQIGVHVPRFLHDDEFRPKVMNAEGLDERQADTRLFAWYREVEQRYLSARIGDKPVDFWRKRFEEWHGRTASRPAVQDQPGQSYVKATDHPYARPRTGTEA